MVAFNHRDRRNQLGCCFVLLISFAVVGCSSQKEKPDSAEVTQQEEGFAPAVRSNGSSQPAERVDEPEVAQTGSFNPLAGDEPEEPAENSSTEPSQEKELKRQVTQSDKENSELKKQLAALQQEKIDLQNKRLEEEAKRKSAELPAFKLPPAEGDKSKMKKESSKEFDIKGLEKLAGSKEEQKEKEKKRAARVNQNRTARSSSSVGQFVPARNSSPSPFSDNSSLRNMLSGGNGSSFGSGANVGAPPHGSAGSFSSGASSESGGNAGVASVGEELSEVDFDSLMGPDFAGTPVFEDGLAGFETPPHDMAGELDDFGNTDGEGFSGPGEEGFGMPPHEGDPHGDGGQPGEQGDGPHHEGAPPADIETVRPPVIDF